ncbi:MAG: hypothetical protein HY243_05950 [Proteobacteria bacterium]|nr:hypothetical protein [Pseudomonadota bacterium]
MTVPSKAPKAGCAALGVRAHSGWAAVIILAGSAQEPEIIDRRRIELRKPGDENARFPFHHVESWKLDRAMAFIQSCTKSSNGYALTALSDIAAHLKKRSLVLSGCGLLTASGRTLPDLANILASHSLIHAAEGEFFRDAIADACARKKIAVSRVKEREALTWAAARLGLTDVRLKLKMDALGKPLGPPWTADQKLATAAALLVLAG